MNLTNKSVIKWFKHLCRCFRVGKVQSDHTTLGNSAHSTEITSNLSYTLIPSYTCTLKKMTSKEQKFGCFVLFYFCFYLLTQALWIILKYQSTHLEFRRRKKCVFLFFFTSPLIKQKSLCFAWGDRHKSLHTQESLGDEYLIHGSAVNNCNSLVNHSLQTPKQHRHQGPAHESSGFLLLSFKHQAVCSQSP